MPAWTPSGNVHVNLGSSTPCWNDVIEGVLLEPTEAIRPVFSNEETKNINFIMIKISEPFVTFLFFVMRLIFH